MRKTVLYIVVPCYNEEEVLPITSGLFLGKLNELIGAGKISDDSRVLYVDDGSRDRTWEIIRSLAAQDRHFAGIQQSRNRGHQNAVLAGLMEAMEKCDAAISIDCDGQDDVNAMDGMIDAYHDGCEIVYGVRANRDSDSLFKRITAEGYYRLLSFMGADVVFNHADYRLMSSRALREFSQFREVNLFLRGMVPLVGFKSTCVSYDRTERRAGKSHYPLRKMLRLAFDGITSLSVRPISLVAVTGLVIFLLSLIGILWVLITALCGSAVPGWASTACIVFLMGGLQALFLGVIGVYVGKIYLEVKGRPRYIISARTGEEGETEAGKEEK
ncbi:MAG: glycosyltransferase family 2 protein [Clostridia bacterium]|nr:glycosyltransferase family 2 protein [Clostridia bacterium]